jgi:eukaryotic-like serine/threonine-protein kinase
VTSPPRNRYEQKGAVGSGGFGEVSLWMDKFLDREIAYKTLKNVKDSQQLVNEVLKLSNLRSKHVVNIFDVVKNTNGTLAGMIIEYVPGEDLVNYHTQAFDTNDYMRLTLQMARGISDLHAAKIVHRDIKLQNIKRSSEGIVKIFDFGIAGEKDVDITFASRATQIYASPELYKPPILVVSTIDVYAFGICCWLMLTKTLPKVLYESPPQRTAKVTTITSIQPKLPSAVARMIDACLDVDPRSRPQMMDVSIAIETELLRGKHRATLFDRPTFFEINVKNPEASISGGRIGAVSIAYDGISFRFKNVTGEVFYNGLPANNGDVLPLGCVIIIGRPERGADRRFVEFSVSHPELVV